MKIAALAVIASFACGAALAQNSTNTTNRTGAGTQKHSVATKKQPTAANDSLAAKTKRGLQRAGNATRNAAQKVKTATRRTTDGNIRNEQTARGDGRGMGATGTDGSEANRRSRMDDAYGNWKSGQK